MPDVLGRICAVLVGAPLVLVYVLALYEYRDTRRSECLTTARVLYEVLVLCLRVCTVQFYSFASLPDPPRNHGNHQIITFQKEKITTPERGNIENWSTIN